MPAKGKSKGKVRCRLLRRIQPASTVAKQATKLHSVGIYPPFKAFSMPTRVKRPFGILRHGILRRGIRRILRGTRGMMIRLLGTMHHGMQRVGTTTMIHIGGFQVSSK